MNKTMYRVMYRVMLFAGITFLVLGAYLASYPPELPEPFVVELPKFEGRVLPDEAVRIGTFSILADFDSVSSWGEDGVMTYYANSLTKRIVLNAWRPDPKTPGAFEHARKVVEIPWVNYSTYIDKVDYHVGAVTATAGHNYATAKTAFSLGGCLLALSAVCIYISRLY